MHKYQNEMYKDDFLKFQELTKLDYQSLKFQFHYMMNINQNHLKHNEMKIILIKYLVI